MECKPANLLNLVRNGVIDSSFYGFLAHYQGEELLWNLGEAAEHPFFLRSLAKPIQASLMIDFKTHEYFGFNKEEIAISCASHSAQNYHIELVRSILDKTGLSEKALLCGVHPPFAPREDVLNMPVHNNCSGKHALMLALCVQNDWDISNYLDFEHPLQKLIYQKHLELSLANELPKTLDGCGAPIYAFNFKQISRAFLELFKKYDTLADAFLTSPLVIGGKDRLDSKIMLQSGGKLIAKVGAGGFLIVINPACGEILIIKLTQDNNPQREIIASYALNRIGWLDSPLIDYEFLNLHATCVGEYIFCDKI